MRTARCLLALLALSLSAWACGAFDPGPGRPFSEDRRYVLQSESSAWCTASGSGTPAGCQQVLEFHADGTAVVPQGSLVLYAQYVVRGRRVEVTPSDAAAGAARVRFDMSSDGSTLTERGSGRVWQRYELLRHLSRTRALA
jgi:hypothetical protein